METSSAKELSPAPSTSAHSNKGLKGVIAKARLVRKDDPPTISVNGTEDGGERSSIRNSVDSLMDKARASRGSSLDDGLPSGPSNLSKLIPGRTKKKRRKREEAEQAQQETEDERGRSVEDQAATSAAPKSLAANRSRSTLGEDGEDSLLTVESDTEIPVVSPPPLVSRDSHIGYLTSSSPLIKTSTASGASSSTNLESPPFQNPQYQKSNPLTSAASGPALSANLAPQHAATSNTADGGRSLSRSDGSRSRGVSPGAKIKDVFTIGSRRKADSPPKSPDRSSVISSGSGNGLSGLLGKGENRHSINLGRVSKASDSMQLLDTDSAKSPTTSVRDLPSIVTSPRTPNSAGLDAPATTVTPPTPIDQRQDGPRSPSLKDKPPPAFGSNQNTIVSASGNMISHRRVRSDSTGHGPSKLSSSMSAPLTPMIEETRTPGVRTPGSQGTPGGPGGFFSSVFSAAQNAANTFSNTLANNPTRSRSSTQPSDDTVAQDFKKSSTLVSEGEETPVEEKKPLAIDTIGTGDLSLSHLGIDSPPTANSSVAAFPNLVSEKSRDGISVLREEAAARAESASATRAVSAAYSEKPSEESLSTPVAEDVAPGVRPRSTYESSIATGDKTPPNGSIHDGDHGFRRNGSVRSRVGAVARRHRNSSSATGTTIGAAIGAGHAALANPAAGGSTPKLTGFAVASKKRNRDFHQLFRSVPEDDYLIEDYSCALQRDIILAGRIYVSEGHICFSSNILGWVTTLVISFDEVVSVEKENTAMVFPNAIAIQTLHARHTFRSLLSREATYELLIAIWKLSHPSLKSSLNGVRLDQGGTGDKTEKVDPSGSDEPSDVSDEEDEIYDEDEEDEEGGGSGTEAGDGSIVGSEDAGDQLTKPATRKASAMGVAVGTAAGSVPVVPAAKAGEKAADANAASVDFPGPPTHGPTECSDGDTHYERMLKDDIIPAPLGKVYSMVFGPASGGFMAKWLLDDIKVTELQLEDDKKGLSEEIKSRTFSYIKPLYASIGPKSTKCVVTETIDSIDLEKAVSVTASTQTPDVPSGNIFVTKTRFCFMWAPGNTTRVIMNFTIEWTGKSWLKGPIEKGANDGQLTYCNDLVKALKSGLTSRPRAGTNGSKMKTKGKRRKGDAGPATRSATHEKSVTRGDQQQSSTWGLFEPVHGILGPVVDIFSPLISANAVIGFLLFVIIIGWLYGPKSESRATLGYAGMSTPERVAAYESIWQREESDLWNWLEDRVGMHEMAYPGHQDHDVMLKATKQREKKLKDRTMRSKLADVKMSEREVNQAIWVTEERLKVLKRAVEQKKGFQGDTDSVAQGDPQPSE